MENKIEITQNDIDNVVEMFYNETTDLDEIADRCDLSILDVVNIINNE